MLAWLKGAKPTKERYELCRPYKGLNKGLNKGNGAMNPIHGGTTKGPYQVVLGVIFGK